MRSSCADDAFLAWRVANHRAACACSDRTEAPRAHRRRATRARRATSRLPAVGRALDAHLRPRLVGLSPLRGPSAPARLGHRAPHHRPRHAPTRRRPTCHRVPKLAPAILEKSGASQKRWRRTRRRVARATPSCRVEAAARPPPENGPKLARIGPKYFPVAVPPMVRPLRRPEPPNVGSPPIHRLPRLPSKTCLIHLRARRRPAW